MKNISTLFLFICVSFATLLTGQTTIELVPFSSIKTSGSVTVELIPSNKYSATYENSSNAGKLTISSVNGTLMVKLPSSHSRGSATKAYVKVHYKGDLESLKASASSVIKSESTIRSKYLTLASSSAAKINADINVAELHAEGSSASTMKLTGKADKSVIKASSGASVLTHDVKTQSARVDATSGSKISLWASKSLSGSANSGGTIKYKGEPQSNDIDLSSGGAATSMSR